MGNYTAEQVLKEADWAVSCERYVAATMLRAYAATLRQQAFSQFANPEALADWLDALHECHADGSVGNRKWEAAQVAARAIRSLNEPSGNSGQLRQQAGRVDEVPANCRQRLSAEGKPYPRSSCDACGKWAPRWNECDAALAQNTQVDGEVTEDATRQAQDVYEAACNEPSDYFGIEAVLKLHAERARVPDADAARFRYIVEFNWIGTKTRCAERIQDSDLESARRAVDRAMAAAARARR